MKVASAAERSSVSIRRHPTAAAGWIALGDRAVERTRRLARHPYRFALGLLGLNLCLAGLFVAAGATLFADPAEFFRELMPGTWLSFAQLALVAITAWAIERELTGTKRLRLDSFWGLSALVFAIFAVDEITQLTIFLADGLSALGALAPQGFQDLDAFLLVVLFVAAGVALARYARELLRDPAALAMLAAGVVLGAASQALDSVLPATQSEFVAEESLKLAAEPFLLGGFLIVLNRTLRRGRVDEAHPASRLRV